MQLCHTQGSENRRACFCVTRGGWRARSSSSSARGKFPFFSHQRTCVALLWMWSFTQCRCHRLNDTSKKQPCRSFEAEVEEAGGHLASIKFPFFNLLKWCLRNPTTWCKWMCVALMAYGPGISWWTSDSLHLSHILFWHTPLLSSVSGRWRHRESKELQAAYNEETRGPETQDPPGVRTQVHVHFPSSANFLFPLQRVHLVRRSILDEPPQPARLCTRDLIVYLSLINRGVFGKQGYQCQGEQASSSLIVSGASAHRHDPDTELWFFSSVHLCGSQTMSQACRHCVSTHEEAGERTSKNSENYCGCRSSDQ